MSLSFKNINDYINNYVCNQRSLTGFIFGAFILSMMRVFYAHSGLHEKFILYKYRLNPQNLFAIRINLIEFTLDALYSK